MSAEDLQALQAAAAAADESGHQQAAPEGEPAPTPEQAAEADAQAWAAFAVDLGQMAREKMPALREYWTDENLSRFGASLSRLAQHYGWNIGEAVSHPVAAVGVAALPLVWPFARPLVNAQLAKMGAAPMPAGVSGDVPRDHPAA